MMSFWTLKKIVRIVHWIIQIILIFILSWIISSNFLWGAEDDYGQISQKYLESRSQFLQSNIAEEREQVFANTLEYTTASIDQMINFSSELRLIVQNFTWLEDEDKLSIISFIEDELQYLDYSLNQILLAEDENDIKELFVPVYENWTNFRYDMNVITREIFSNVLFNTCEKISETDDLSIVDSDLELRKYAEFVSACEDWAMEDVNISSKMLEWIRVVE